MNDFLVTIAIVAHVMGISLPEAVQQPVYIVPTVVTAEAPDETAEPVQQFEWRVEPHFYIDSDSEEHAPIKLTDDRGPDIDAQAAIIMDVDTQQLLWQKNPDQPIPIASITKLMTALVWIDHQPAAGMDHVHTFGPDEDTLGGKELNLAHGEQLRAFDLMRSSIVGSDNDTALGLAHSTEIPEDQFVALMNEKAYVLGMDGAHFDDPTGLSAANVATPLGVARLAREAFRHEEIQIPAAMAVHEQRTVDSDQLTRVYTTNTLLYDTDLEIVGGKTGYIPEAGYCVVVQAHDPESGRDIIVVVLGTPYEHARFEEAKELINWTYNNYAWN